MAMGSVVASWAVALTTEMNSATEMLLVTPMVIPMAMGSPMVTVKLTG